MLTLNAFSAVTVSADVVGAGVATVPALVHVEAVHLSFGTAAGTLTAAWHTDTGPVPGTPCVVWSELELLASNATPTATTTATTTATRARTTPLTSCGVTQAYNVSNISRVFVHNAVMGPLKLGARYSYHVAHILGKGKGSVYCASGEHEFTAPGSPMLQGQRVIFFGDSGNSNEWRDGTVPAVAGEVHISPSAHRAP